MGIEIVLLALICLTPWAYGAVHPGFEFLLNVGLATLLLLWAGIVILAGRFTWKGCVGTFCLAALFLTAIWQMVPLSRPILGVLSPQTRSLYDELLPSQPEQFYSPTPAGDIPQPDGATISLDPGSTRQMALRLLAILLVFAVVRNQLATEGALRRLALVCLLNAVALSVFGVIQFATSTKDRVYWQYPTESGRVFGPFVNANHFAYHVNMCAGLGVGLLAAQIIAIRPRSRRGSTEGASHRRFRWWNPDSLRELLGKPSVLWVSFATGCILTAVLVSLSRGGFLSFLGASLISWIVWRLTTRGRLRGDVALLIGVGVVGLAGWIGSGVIVPRLATLLRAETLEEDRVHAWGRVLPATVAFPIWGTGYGTFGRIEVMYRRSQADQAAAYDHAHNDYLELLVEGGIVGLGVGLTVLAFVLLCGVRAVRRLAGRPAGGLALGALLAIIGCAIHGFVDFGAHIPANALLATAIASHLCSLGGAPGTEAEPARPEPRFPLRTLGAVMGTLGLLVLGSILCVESWRAHQVNRFQRAARGGDPSDRVGRDTQSVRWIRSAARSQPLNAQLQLDLAEAYFKLADSRNRASRQSAQAREVAQFVLLWVRPPSFGGPHPALPACLDGICRSIALARGAVQEAARIKQDTLFVGVRHYVRARDLCPIQGNVQLALAANRDLLKRADPYEDYLARGQRLEPSNADLWYLSGIIELANEHPERAWPCWQRSLQLAEVHLAAILQRASWSLSPEELVARVMPDEPERLLQAVRKQYPGTRGKARALFLQKALELLDERPTPPAKDDLLVRARVLGELGRTAEAVRSYQEVLAKQTQDIETRYEMARLLGDRGEFRQAREEALTILAFAPGHRGALDLLELIRKRTSADGP